MAEMCIIPNEKGEGARCGILRQGLMLGFVCVLPMVAAGCHSITTRKDRDKEPELKASNPSDALVIKTDFKNKVDAKEKQNVHLEMGRLYEGQGNFEAAVNEYQKSLDACKREGRFQGGSKVPRSQEAESHRRMAGAFDRLGKFAQAEAHYRSALALSPNDPKVWNDSGYSYYLQGRQADAEQSLKTAAKIDPNNPRIQTNLGLAMAAAGKTDEALAALSKAGGPAAGHANLAYLLASLGRTGEARKHYQSALALQPSMAPVREALARLDVQGAQSTQLVSAARPAGATTDSGIHRVATPPRVSPDSSDPAMLSKVLRSYRR